MGKAQRVNSALSYTQTKGATEPALPIVQAAWHATQNGVARHTAPANR